MQRTRQSIAKGRITLKMILVFVMLLAGAIFIEQYSSYLKQRNQLQYGNAQSRQRLNLLVSTLPRQEEFRKELDETERHYRALRNQLPVETELEVFKRGVEEQLKVNGLKVQAVRVAHYSRPFYQEIRLDYSIKGSVKAVQQVFAKLEKQPRLVLSSGPQKESFEFTGLTLSIFSIPPKSPQESVETTCLPPPEDVWMPILQNKLASLYQNYIRTCNTVVENSTLYREIQRYRYLAEEVQFLEQIIATIKASR